MPFYFKIAFWTSRVSNDYKVHCSSNGFLSWPKGITTAVLPKAKDSKLVHSRLNQCTTSTTYLMVWRWRDTSDVRWIYVLQNHLKHEKMTWHDCLWQQEPWLQLSLQHLCFFVQSVLSSAPNHTSNCKVEVYCARTAPKQNGSRWKGRGAKGGRISAIAMALPAVVPHKQSSKGA